jgi:CheY-like chemotaxis protein
LEIYNLKICDRIAQAMGGRLTLERPSVLSSLVTLTLPLPIITSRDNTSPVAEQQHQEVLIVDDNIINLTVVSGLLMKLGYSVETAGNGREAIEKVKHKRYDVILMDCQMPHMDGYETTRSIRDAYRPERGPLIIALTANPLDDGPAQAKQAGMDSIITKPISLDMLIKTVGYAKKMPTTTPLQAVMIMDFKAFSMGLGNDHELMQTAIMRYFEEIDGMMDRLRTEVERGDAMATAKSAHTLKGMTSLFAAQSLVEAHRNLEMAGKDGRVQEFPGLLKRIESLTELFKMELKKLTDEKKEVA